MDIIIDGLESRKNGEKYHDFVLTDAILYIKKAQECIEDGLQNPEEWWNSNMTLTKTYIKLFPLIYLMTQQEQFHNQMNLPSEESSQEDLEKDPKAEDTF